MGLVEAPITRVDVAAYRIPTDAPEADGTFAWDATTLVCVHVEAGGRRGLGYAYASQAAGHLIGNALADVVVGQDAMAISGLQQRLLRQVRNLGRPGIASTALSALDIALWDLKAKLLDVSLVCLLGDARDHIDIYGSGGFTSYPLSRLREQLSGWVAEGIGRVKMKIGAQPDADLDRVAAAREAIGEGPRLMVDANGAYRTGEAVFRAAALAPYGVDWLEEPVSSDDLAGLGRVRARAPAGMQVAAGEYGYDPIYFRRMLQAEAVDVLQADATRCLGISGFLAADQLCTAFCTPLSAHCAPSAHVHVACACREIVHLEYFHDHVRIERMLFDGALTPEQSRLRPDRSRPGLGIELKAQDAAPYAL